MPSSGKSRSRFRAVYTFTFNKFKTVQPLAIAHHRGMGSPLRNASKLFGILITRFSSSSAFASSSSSFLASFPRYLMISRSIHTNGHYDSQSSSDSEENNSRPFNLLNELQWKGGAPKIPSAQDKYHAAIHHICAVVRNDVYMERTLQKMGFKVTSELVWRVLRDCSNFGKESYRFFNWAKQQPSYDPTTIEYEELIRILGVTQQWDTMWKVAEEMKRHGYLLSGKTFATIIESYGKSRLVNRAVEVFNRMKNFNCPQTTQVYNALLSALCEARNFQGSYALIRRMVRKGCKLDTESYSILVNAWCGEGKLAEAQEFLEEMSKTGQEPPAGSRDVLINGLLTAGNLEMAKELVRKMTKEGFLPKLPTFNSFLEALCNAGEIDICVNLMAKASKLGLYPDNITYRIMIGGASRCGKMDEAFRFLHNSMEDGHKPFPSLYAPLLKALCKRGQFGEAYSLFNDMKDKGHPPNRPVYTMLIRLSCRGGRFLEAATFLVEMTELNLVPRAQNFDMVIGGLKNVGKYSLAEKIERLQLSAYGM